LYQQTAINCVMKVHCRCSAECRKTPTSPPTLGLRLRLLLRSPDDASRESKLNSNMDRKSLAIDCYIDLGDNSPAISRRSKFSENGEITFIKRCPLKSSLSNQRLSWGFLRPLLRWLFPHEDYRRCFLSLSSYESRKV